MAKALEHSADGTQKRTAGIIDWRKKISDHVAYALLIYTGLQIFMTMQVLNQNHNSIMPYLALVVLVFAIIPGCRLFEARWTELGEADAHDPALRSRFNRDCMIIWAIAIGLPLVLTAFFKGVTLLVA